MKKLLKHMLSSPKTTFGALIGFAGLGMTIYTDPSVLADPQKAGELAAMGLAAAAALAGKDWGQPKPKP